MSYNSKWYNRLKRGVAVASKYYAVRQGRQPGMYRSWDACRDQVQGYSGAEYKSFVKEEDAVAYLKGKACPGQADQGLVAYVDGSYDKATGLCAYGLVLLRDGSLLEKEKHAFYDPELALMHNVAGELAGARRAMEWAVEAGEKALTIAYDYAGIEKWCTGEWQAKKAGTQAYRDDCQEVRSRLSLSFLKVKGHSGDTYNEMADALAREAIQEAKRKA